MVKWPDIKEAEKADELYKLNLNGKEGNNGICTLQAWEFTYIL